MLKICDAFTRGAFAPGEIVSLRSLAAQLGTSMTPVREAVRRLVAEGALIDTPSRTLEVPPFDAARLLELKAARLALETILLDRAIDRIDPATLAVLDEMIATPGHVDGRPDLKLNYDFHFALYERAESECHSAAGQSPVVAIRRFAEPAGGRAGGGQGRRARVSRPDRDCHPTRRQTGGAGGPRRGHRTQPYADARESGIGMTTILRRGSALTERA